jgi:hypothetical protein
MLEKLVCYGILTEIFRYGYFLILGGLETCMGGFLNCHFSVILN